MHAPWRNRSSVGSAADLAISPAPLGAGSAKKERGASQRSDRRHHRTGTEAAARISNGHSTYQIGQEIGRGGFGTVFQALNTDTGDFVAVKRVALHNIDHDSLAAIRQEIDLLKKLNHVHIVQYIDTIQTDSFLHIVLEIMESSLSAMCKKFGNFSESLTAIYLTQVLEGLKYLHEQGVLHRDIKGANILTTKNGLVKLADFGVALRLSDAGAAPGEDVDVVGTPYWMAPEIVEMTGITTACDVWSLGCTVIELLTGKPPYFDLPQMAALYKIVQDDHPPLPDGITAALHDFLLQCFKKEPQMRASALQLLSHPWLRNPRGHLQRVGDDVVAKHAAASGTAAATAAANGSAAGAAAAGAAAADRQNVLKTVKTYAQLMQEHSPQRRYDLSASDVADLNQIAEQICEEADEAAAVAAAAAAAAAGAAAPRPPAGMRTPPPRRSPDANSAGESGLPTGSNGVSPSSAAAAVALSSKAREAAAQALDADNDEDWDQDFNGSGGVLPVTGARTGGAKLSLGQGVSAGAGINASGGETLASNSSSADGSKQQQQRPQQPMGHIGPESEEVQRQLRAMRGSSGGGSIGSALAGVGASKTSTPTLDPNALDDWGDEDLTPVMSSSGALTQDTRLGSDAGLAGSGTMEVAGLMRFVESDETFDDIELPQEGSAGGGGGGLSFFKLSVPSSSTALADKLKQKMMRQQVRVGAAAPADPFDKELELELEVEADSRGVRLERDSHARIGGEIFAELSRMQAAADAATGIDARGGSAAFGLLSSGQAESDGGGGGGGGGGSSSDGGSSAAAIGGSSGGGVAGSGSALSLDDVVVEGCGRIRAMLEGCPEARFYVVSAEHGVVPLLQLVEARGLGPVASAQVVAVVNRIVEGNPKALEHLALVGIIPRILSFVAPPPPPPLPAAAAHQPLPSARSALLLPGSRAAAAAAAAVAAAAEKPVQINVVTPLRAEAARFVRALCHTSDFALQLFVSCGGLQALVDMLAIAAPLAAAAAASAAASGDGEWTPDDNNKNSNRGENLAAFKGILRAASFSAASEAGNANALADTTPEARRLVRIGLDGLLQVFSLNRIRRNDCCRLLLRLDLLPNVIDVFSGLLRAVLAADDCDAAGSNSAALPPPPRGFNSVNNGASGAAASEAAGNDNAAAAAGGGGGALQQQRAASSNVGAGARGGAAGAGDRSDAGAAAATTTGAASAVTLTGTLTGLATAAGGDVLRPTPRSLSSDNSWVYLEKAAHVLLTFSKSDKAVKEGMASEKCVQGIMQALRDLSPTYLRRLRAAKLAVTLLQVVKNVSMEPGTLAALEAAGAVQTLVPLLERTGGPCDKEMENQVLQCMFYLCRISRKRQDRAAAAGLVPYLQRCISEEAHLKQFALNIVCDLAHAGPVTRDILWANGGVGFYLGVMTNPADRHWHVTALRSISAWLLADTERVEAELIQPGPLEIVLGLFRSAEGADFEKVVEDLHLMMSKSNALVTALGGAPSFVEEVKHRLHYPKAIVAKTLLGMLRAVYRAHPNPRQLLRENDLYPSVAKLARNNAQVLVAEIATQLLQDFDEQGKYGI